MKKAQAITLHTRFIGRIAVSKFFVDAAGQRQLKIYIMKKEMYNKMFNLALRKYEPFLGLFGLQSIC